MRVGDILRYLTPIGNDMHSSRILPVHTWIFAKVFLSEKFDIQSNFGEKIVGHSAINLLQFIKATTRNLHVIATLNTSSCTRIKLKYQAVGGCLFG